MFNIKILLHNLLNEIIKIQNYVSLGVVTRILFFFKQLLIKYVSINY